MYEACPNAEINQCWAKLGSFLGGYSQRKADVAENHRALAANFAACQVRTGLNLKTAKPLGVVVLPSLLRADGVIEQDLRRLGCALLGVRSRARTHKICR
jgi:hypothetical protein